MRKRIISELLADDTSITIKNIILISLNRTDEVFSCDHSLLVHEVVAIYLPVLKLHLAVVIDEVFADLAFVGLVAATNGADAVFEDLLLKVALHVNFFLIVKFWNRPIQKVLMYVLDVPEPLGHWLVTNFTIHNFLIGKICLKHPENGSLIWVYWALFLNLESIVILDEL